MTAIGIRYWAILALLGPIVISSGSCTKMKSVKTVANMQTSAARIEAIRAQGHKLEAVDIRRALEAVNRGDDGWGTPLRYRLWPDGNYILVSAGPDRTFNVHDLGEYLERASTGPRAQNDDIVFRNDQQVTRVGK